MQKTSQCSLNGKHYKLQSPAMHTGDRQTNRKTLCRKTLLRKAPALQRKLNNKRILNASTSHSNSSMYSTKYNYPDLSVTESLMQIKLFGNIPFFSRLLTTKP